MNNQIYEWIIRVIGEQSENNVDYFCQRNSCTSLLFILSRATELRDCASEYRITESPESPESTESTETTQTKTTTCCARSYLTISSQ